MAVQVILGDVEDRRHRRVELRDGLQLEGGDFADGDVARAHLQDRLRVGRADVAHHPGAAAGVFEDLAQQGRSGGLAIGAGDGKERAGGFAVGDSSSPITSTPSSRARSTAGCVSGMPGAHDERVHALDERQRVFHAQLPANAGHVEVVQRARELFARRLHRRWSLRSRARAAALPPPRRCAPYPAPTLSEFAYCPPFCADVSKKGGCPRGQSPLCKNAS